MIQTPYLKIFAINLILKRMTMKFEKVSDHYFKNGVLFLKVGYVGYTLGKYNII